jgi:hypothetical protein
LLLLLLLHLLLRRFLMGITLSRVRATCSRRRKSGGKMKVNGIDQALKRRPALLLQPPHFLNNDLRQRVERQTFARALLTRHAVAARRMRAENVLAQVLAVALLRRGDTALVKSSTKMRGAVHKLHQPVGAPAHRAHAASDPHELRLLHRLALTIVLEDVAMTGLLAHKAIATS